MRRLSIKEVHERSWYPKPLRKLFQDSLGVGLRLFRAYEPATEPLQRFISATGANEVLDLCSGSGETASRVWTQLADAGRGAPDLYLSDLYPHATSSHAGGLGHGTRVSYVGRSVDANAVPEGLPRVRTMFTGLHHFDEAEVIELLRSAARDGDGFAAFEMTERKPAAIIAAASALLTCGPLTVAALRPFRFSTLLWGLLIPILPVTMAIDAVLSQLRSYTPKELASLAERANTPEFEWHVGQARMPVLPGKITYVMGWRRRPAMEGN